MSDEFAIVHAAKTHLSQLVAQLGLAPRSVRAALSDDDPLFNLDDFAIDGAGGNLANSEIDHVLYGNP